MIKINTIVYGRKKIQPCRVDFTEQRRYNYNMVIRFAEERDLNPIVGHDRHIAKNELENRIKQKTVFVAEVNSQFSGWLRYNLFWDNTPFMNMLYVLPPFRGRGVGKALIAHFEKKMKEDGYNCVMTSTACDETAKFLYEKLGYKNVGGFDYPDDPYEIIYLKKFDN